MLYYDNNVKNVYTPGNINNTRGVGQDFHVIKEYIATFSVVKMKVAVSCTVVSGLD